MPCQCGDIVIAVAQRGEPDRKNIKAIKQIFAEPTLLNKVDHTVKPDTAPGQIEARCEQL